MTVRYTHLSCWICLCRIFLLAMEIESHLDSLRLYVKSIDRFRILPVILVFPVYQLLPICKGILLLGALLNNQVSGCF